MDLKYNLDDRMPKGKLWFFSFQHVILFISASGAMAVVVGISIGLSMPELSAMIRRAFFISGLFSFVQGIWGHRYPIIDGPSALWIGIILLIAPTMSGNMQVLRTDLGMGIIIGGLSVFAVTALGLMPYVFKLFTPSVNGVLLMFMVIQISKNIVNGMIGLSDVNNYIEGGSILVFVFSIAVVLILNFFAKGFVKSIAVLIGTAAGWLAAIPTGYAVRPESAGESFVALPEAFAFGMPTWNPGIIIVSIFASFMLLSMVYASIKGMSEVIATEIDEKSMKKAVMFHGLGAAAAGLFPAIPNLPYITPIGMVIMTGVASRRPFLIGSLLMLAMGLVTPVGSFFASIPIPVGYAIMTVMFSLIFKQGLHEVQKDAAVFATERVGYVIGISLIIGVGVMFLPFETFTHLPGILPYLLSNGLIDGTIIAIILDRMLLKRG